MFYLIYTHPVCTPVKKDTIIIDEEQCVETSELEIEKNEKELTTRFRAYTT